MTGDDPQTNLIFLTQVEAMDLQAIMVKEAEKLLIVLRYSLTSTDFWHSIFYAKFNTEPRQNDFFFKLLCKMAQGERVSWEKIVAVRF